ncbi:hypothetical protein [Salinicoccus halodurans]|uniref:hypothetical protein n=1 Tax=Salinicoccus halodurans TaxID=407035 RepID=UPI000AD3871C|nr:hypothetical protein [Salinicoccus halodurans]
MNIKCNAFCNFVYTVSFAMCGIAGINDSIGEDMTVGFDGVLLVEESNKPD